MTVIIVEKSMMVVDGDSSVRGMMNVEMLLVVINYVKNIITYGKVKNLKDKNENQPMNVHRYRTVRLHFYCQTARPFLRIFSENFQLFT